MAKINSNNMDDLEQLQEYGVKIKTRYKKRKLPKVKFNRKKENRKPQYRPKASLKENYEDDQ